jgi:hypothetical protein
MLLDSEKSMSPIRQFRPKVPLLTSMSIVMIGPEVERGGLKAIPRNSNQPHE